MKLPKPINILYEIVIYTFSMGFLIYASKIRIANWELMRTIGQIWIAIGFFTMILVITIRALRQDLITRLVSAFCFGFVAGAFIGIFFIASELTKSGILENIVGILGAGVIAGMVASLCCYFLSWILEAIQSLYQKRNKRA